MLTRTHTERRGILGMPELKWRVLLVLYADDDDDDDDNSGEYLQNVQLLL